MIESAKRGNIQIAKHHIELIGSFIRRMKQYPVPLGLHNEVKVHMKNPNNIGIIEEKEVEWFHQPF